MKALETKEYVDRWLVKSEIDEKKNYLVSKTKSDTYECSCVQWTRNESKNDCRHIKTVKMFESGESVRGVSRSLTKNEKNVMVKESDLQLIREGKKSIRDILLS